MQVKNTPIPTKVDKPTAKPNQNPTQAQADKAGAKVKAPMDSTSKAPSKPNVAAEAAPNDNKTSAYLKVVSRIEQMLETDELPDKAIESFGAAIKVRLDDLSDQDKKGILALKEAKAIELESVDKLVEILSKGLKDEKKSGKILDFLKHPKFAELMEGKEKDENKTYNADGKVGADAAPAKATVTPAPKPSPATTANTASQAYNATKAPATKAPTTPAPAAASGSKSIAA